MKYEYSRYSQAAKLAGFVADSEWRKEITLGLTRHFRMFRVLQNPMRTFSSTARLFGFERIYDLRSIGFGELTESLRLWTDAICINQDSNSERDDQVQRMGETYAQADEVFVWLGNGHHNSSTLREISELSRLLPTLTRG